MENPSKRKNADSALLIWMLGIIAVVLVVVVQFTLFGGRRNGSIVERISSRISTQYSEELNAQMAAHITSTFDHYFQEMNIIEDTLCLIDDLSEEKLRTFIAGVLDNDRVSYLAFVSEDGFVYEENATYLATMKYHFLGDLLQGEQHMICGNETIASKDYVLVGSAFDTPLMLGDVRLCAVVVGVTTDTLSENIVMTSEVSGCYSSIMDQDGSYIVKNPKVPFGGLNVYSILSKFDNVPDETLVPLKTAVQNRENYSLKVDGNMGEEEAYLYFAPIADSDWYIVNCIPGSLIRSSVEELQESLLLLALISVIFVVLVAMFIILALTSSRQKLHKSQLETAQALQKAQVASNAKTAFLFNMSHDIRTPMNAILGFTDIALSHYKDDAEKAKDSLEKIRTSGKHLLELINDILEMSRIEAGKLEITERPMDVRKGMETVENMSQSLAKDKGVELICRGFEIANPYVVADELHVNEMLINLISNGIKYTPKGGRVIYTFRQEGESVDGVARYSMEISDNGIGMSEEFQTHLFETFSREKNTTVSKIEGTGLGLSIVKKIVDLMGGSIDVTSKLGEGSTFTVHLPMRVMTKEQIDEYLNESDAQQPQQLNFSLEGKKVLYVEDNELNREIGVELLTEKGLAVDTAEDGEVAVMVISEKGTEYYDAILMDIQMPVMDGYEATKAIRAMPGGGNVPIIALSANAFKEDVEKSLGVGMDGHIAKPINIEELCRTLNKLMKK